MKDFYRMLVEFNSMPRAGDKLYDIAAEIQFLVSAIPNSRSNMLCLLSDLEILFRRMRVEKQGIFKPDKIILTYPSTIFTNCEESTEVSGELKLLIELLLDGIKEGLKKSKNLESDLSKMWHEIYRADLESFQASPDILGEILLGRLDCIAQRYPKEVLDKKWDEFSTKEAEGDLKEISQARSHCMKPYHSIEVLCRHDPKERLEILKKISQIVFNIEDSLGMPKKCFSSEMPKKYFSAFEESQKPLSLTERDMKAIMEKLNQIINAMIHQGAKRLEGDFYARYKALKGFEGYGYAATAEDVAQGAKKVAKVFSIMARGEKYHFLIEETESSPQFKERKIIGYKIDKTAAIIGGEAKNYGVICQRDCKEILGILQAKIKDDEKRRASAMSSKVPQSILEAANCKTLFGDANKVVSTNKNW